MSLADDIRIARLPRRRASFTTANTNWSDEILADLRARYENGESYAQIADTLSASHGISLTRHSIAGAINRYVPEKRRATMPAKKFSAPGGAAVRAARSGFMTAFRAKPKAAPPIAARSVAAEPVRDIEASVVRDGISLRDMTHGCCLWIEGDPKHPRPYTCYEPSGDESFCEAHRLLAYTVRADQHKDIRRLIKRAA